MLLPDIHWLILAANEGRREEVLIDPCLYRGDVGGTVNIP